MTEGHCIVRLTVTQAVGRRKEGEKESKTLG